MSCSYYTFRQGDYYCYKKQDYVNEDCYKRYCRGYYYDECPIYRGTDSSSSGGCFLTSACIGAKGLPDDCEELRILRKFRDGWLSEQHGGKELISEYYTIAPQIVDSINAQENHIQIHEEIYQKLVVPCVDLIHAGDYDAALNLYKKTTQQLAQKYIIQEEN